MKRLLSLFTLPILFLLILPVQSWALTFVATSAIDATSDLTTSATTICAKPTGTAENDIMWAVIKRLTANTWVTEPTGWTLAATDADAATTYSTYLYYRVAGSSEGSTYTWVQSATSRMGCSIYTYRGSFNTSSPIDVVSNTSYETSDTIVRGASMTVAAANSVLLFFAIEHASTTHTFTPATVPTTFTEDTDAGNASESRLWRSAASVIWSGSGATGTMDAAVSTASTSKHAFVVALAPIAAAASLAPQGLMMGVGK